MHSFQTYVRIFAGIIIFGLVTAKKSLNNISEKEVRGLLKQNRRVYDGQDCGLSVQQEVAMRIMGGTQGGLGEFPWIAHLAYRSNLDGTSKGECGGSLINDKYVLTAAHCCEDDKTATLSFVQIGGDQPVRPDTGSNRINAKNSERVPLSTIQDIPVESVTIHPLHESSSEYGTNDICLVRLRKRVKFSEPRPTWPDYLQKLQVPVLSKRDCKKRWPSFKMHDSDVCAGGQLGEDACAGDSGGPLMFKVMEGGRQRYFLMGLLSYGRSCNPQDTDPRPSVYMKVSSYIPWILKNIRP